MKKLLTLACLLSTAAVSMAQVTFKATGGDNFDAKEGCAKAMDNDLGTKWLAGSRDKNLLFKASETVQLTGYTIVTANDNDRYWRCPNEWELLGSNDAEAATNEEHPSWVSINYLRGNKVIQHENYTAYYFSINTAAPYKYYKLKIVTGDGDNESSQISEFIPSYVREFVPNYIPVDGVGGDGAEGYKSICDGNTSSKVCTTQRYDSSDSSPYHYFVFRTTEAVAVSKYKFCTGNDCDNRDPKDWVLYGMNTSETPERTDARWVEIDSKTEQNLLSERKTWQEFTVDDPTGEKYNTFMLKLTKIRDNGDMTQFQEFRLNDDESGYTALDGVGGTGGEGYAKGFDGDVNTKVCTNQRVTDGFFAYWFIFKTAKDLAVNGYKFCTGNDASSRDPQSWNLYGMKSDTEPSRESNDWVLIDTKNDVDNFPTDRQEWVEYSVEIPTANEYNYFKLEVTKIRSGEMIQFSEFQLEGLDVNYEDKLIAYRGMDTWGDGALANLFDGLPDTKFGGSFSTEGKGSFLTFGPADQEAVSITGYSMQVASEHGCYDRRPKSWKLYGGNTTTAPENLNDWELIDKVEGDTSLPEDYLASAYYHLDAPSKPYKYFMLKFTETQGARDVQLAEFNLFFDHDAKSPWIELREDAKPVFNGVVTFENAKVVRNIPANEWIGLCLPFDYDIPSGWDVRELTDVNGSGESASMIFSSALRIMAGKPYLVKPSGDVTAIDAENKTIGAPAETVSKGGINMVGNLAQTIIPEGSFYINTSGQLKKLTGNTATLKGYRAYFTVDAGSAVKAISLDLGLDGDATGIESLAGEMVEDAAIYNLAGQRLNKVQKGINIINGKKVLR